MIERELRSAVVTGPTGAVGVALCEALLAEGARVYAVVRPDSPRAKALPVHDRLTLMPRDMTTLARLPEQIDGADAFFHLAWGGTTGAARNDVDQQLLNVRCAIDAVRAASALGCSVFVGAGSQAEYGRVDGLLRPETPCSPENGYGMAKLCAGQLTRLESRKLNLAHVWVRILSVYGPHDGAGSMISATVTRLLRREVPPLTEGRQQWDYLYSGDAARALVLCARHGVDGAVYPLGSGQAMPLRDYVEILRDAVDPSLPLGFGMVPYSPLQVTRLQADISALRADTGFEARVSFREGIKKTIDWMRSEP